MAKIAEALRASLSLVGLVGWVAALVKPINLGLSVVGNVDLLANHLGPIGRFFDTGLGTFTSIAVGAAIIGFAIYRRGAQPAVVGLADNSKPLQIELGNDDRCDRTENINGISRRAVHISVFNNGVNDIPDYCSNSEAEDR
jgi:hypothetical protein